MDRAFLVTGGDYHFCQSQSCLWETMMGEGILLELLVFRGMGIIKGPLPERDVSADKLDKPAILFIKGLNNLE